LNRFNGASFNEYNTDNIHSWLLVIALLFWVCIIWKV